MNGYTPLELPKTVGYYTIGGNIGLRWGLRQKPRWLTRFLLRQLLEIEWKDGELK